MQLFFWNGKPFMFIKNHIIILHHITFFDHPHMGDLVWILRGTFASFGKNIIVAIAIFSHDQIFFDSHSQIMFIGFDIHWFWLIHDKCWKKDERWEKDEKWKILWKWWMKNIVGWKNIIVRWMMNNVRWQMKDERWKMKDERWKMKDERKTKEWWKMNNDKWYFP